MEGNRGRREVNQELTIVSIIFIHQPQMVSRPNGCANVPSNGA
jgi:hypothetical protein